MKTTLSLAFALIAGTLSASAQANPQTLSIQATLINGTTQVCGFKVDSLTADLQSSLVAGLQALKEQPLTVGTTSDGCTAFLLTTAESGTPIATFQIVLNELTGTTSSNVTMTLGKVYIQSLKSTTTKRASLTN